MATRFWEPGSTNFGQRDLASVTGTFDGTTFYEVNIGGEKIAGIAGAGVSLVLSTLADAINASENPYAKPVLAAVTGSVGLRLSSEVPGLPFDATYTTSGGTGAWSSTGVTTTSNVSENDWGRAENWSGGAVPVAGDTVIFRDSQVDVRWGLDQSAVDLADLIIEQTYTGKIGLDRTATVTGPAGETNSARPEYRQDYLVVGWDNCRIGETLGPGTPAGSSRLKLNNDKAGASATEVFDTGSSSFDPDLPTVRLLYANAAADLDVRRAPGGLGVAADDPTETSTLGDITVADETPATSVFVGEGTTFANWTQQGGVNVLRAAAAVTEVKVLGGELSIEGEGYALTTLNVDGGATVYPNHVPAAGSAITTVNITAGTVDGSRSRRARTWGTVNLNGQGATLRADSSVVTITTLNEPSGPYLLTAG